MGFTVALLVDGEFYDGRTVTVDEWSYADGPSNIGVYESLGEGSRSEPTRSRSDWAQLRWWQRLNGLSGPEGAAFLHPIICHLEADAVRLRALCVGVEWGYGGDFDFFLAMLREMRDLATTEVRTRWWSFG